MKKYFFVLLAILVGLASCRKDSNLGPKYYIPAAAFNIMYGKFMNQQILLGTGNVIDNTDKGIDDFTVADKRGNATSQYINWGGEVAPHNQEPYLPSHDISFTYAKIRHDVYGNKNVWHFEFPSVAMLFITEHRFYDYSLLTGDYVCQRISKKPDIFTYTYIGPRADVTVTWTMYEMEDGGWWKTTSDSTSTNQYTAYIDLDSLNLNNLKVELLKKKNSILAETADEPEIQN